MKPQDAPTNFRGDIGNERMPPMASHLSRPSLSSAVLAPENAAGHTALLIIDMINCWDFPDAEKLLPRAAAIAPRIAALKIRCRSAGVPVIYANDNRGRWRSDFPALVELSLGQGGTGAAITSALQPDTEDYFVLKRKHSAFFGTPLELLLQHLNARRLILTGVASDQCVLATAMDAVMRDLAVVVPRDCVASQSVARNDTVLRQLEKFQKLPTTTASRIRLVPHRSSAVKEGRLTLLAHTDQRERPREDG